MADSLVYNNTPDTLISGTTKIDTIINGSAASDVTIEANAGKDVIWNLGKYAYIDGGVGDDTINNYNQTEDSYSGEPVKVGGFGSTLLGGEGNDSIYNSNEEVSIDGGAGNDTITNDAKHVTMNGGAGDDTIEVNDRIGSKPGNVVQYSAGGGNDVLFNFSNNSDEADTLQLQDGMSITGGYRGMGSNNMDVILEVANGTSTGTITIKKGVGRAINVLTDGNEDEEAVDIGNPLNETNTVEGRKISGGVLNDYIENSGADVVIDADGGADYVYNAGDRASITGGAGSDTIFNDGDEATLDGGDGGDFIANSGLNVSISGGADADEITNSGAGSTIKAGGGDDIVTVSASTVIEYASGDGNDVIYGYDETSTLAITSGSPKVAVNGLDVVITVGKGKITVKDAVGKTLNWINKDGKLTSKVYGNFDIENESDFNEVLGTVTAEKIYNSGDFSTIDGGAGDDTLKNEGGYVSLSGGAGNDYISDQSWGPSTITGGAGNDTIELANDAYHVIEYGTGDGNDVIVGYGETDSIKITLERSEGRRNDRQYRQLHN